MEKNEIIPGVTKRKATLRFRFMGPYSAKNTPDSIWFFDESDKMYDPAHTYVTTRQIFTLPDIDNSNFPGISTLMINSRPVAGSSGNASEHAMASSRWFLYDVVPVSGFAWKHDFVVATSYGAHDFS